VVVEKEAVVNSPLLGPVQPDRLAMTGVGGARLGKEGKTGNLATSGGASRKGASRAEVALSGRTS
jgi:hypothetical protein